MTNKKINNILIKIGTLGVLLVHQVLEYKSIEDAMSNILIMLLIYNCFLIIRRNIKYHKSNKLDIVFSSITLIMTLAGTYWWLQFKNLI